MGPASTHCRHCPRRSAWRQIGLLCGVHLLAILPGPSTAQDLSLFQPPRTELSTSVTVQEVEQATRAHLERTQQFLAAQQWSEAVQTLRQVMESDSDRLISLPDPADTPLVRYVRIRQYCHGLLCRWHQTAPEALAQYRREVDPIAERWLGEATAQRDPEQLARLVEQFFASSVADQALLLLGEYALERSDFTQARRYWESLSPALRTPATAGSRSSIQAGRPLWLAARAIDDVPSLATGGTEPPSAAASWLAYPDTEIPLPDIRARLAMVSILEGSVERATQEIRMLSALHPQASGTIAGRQGLYAQLLSELLASSKTWPAEPTNPVATFAGSPQRSPARVEDLDIGGAPLWRVPLAPVAADRELLGQTQLRIGEDQHQTLSYFPLVVGSTVLLADRQTIRAWDVETGAATFGGPGPGAALESASGERSIKQAAPGGSTGAVVYQLSLRGPANGTESSQHWGAPRYTLSAVAGRVYARLGSAVTRWPIASDAASTVQGQVVGLDLTAEGRLLPGFPLELEGAEWSFDGAPLCRGNQLFVTLRRQDDVRVESHVACYDALSGRRLWRRFVCAAETPGQGSIREITHNLLTLDGSSLYLNTNLGAVAALDVVEGRILWLLKYPRALYPAQHPDDSTVQFFRDLNPALFERDQIYVAPADCDRIFALDAGRGQLLWSSPPGVGVDVRHLLGTAEDFLIASGENLYWIDRRTGQLVTQFPEPRSFRPGFALAGPRGYGRGLLGRNAIYWPTRERIHVFHIQPRQTAWGWLAQPQRAPLELAAYGLPSGNLVAADRVLLIAGANELVALRNW